MSLPTPLLMGNYRMVAYCPDRGCGVRLPELAGAIPRPSCPFSEAQDPGGPGW